MKTLVIVVSICLLPAALFGATPKEVCDSLAKAATDNNFKAFTTLTFTEGGKPAGKEKNFDKMHKDKMTSLKDLTCGTVTMAGNHAFVEATSQQEKRLIPFIEHGGTWLFDVATYKTFYRHAGTTH